jgi:hypothetical protein
MPSGGANKFTYEDVKFIFEQNGFKLLDTEYVTNNTPMRAICSCGNEVCIRLSHVKKGKKCQKCKSKNSSERMRTSEFDIDLLCKSHGCKFLKSWMQNKRMRILYLCKCGNESEAYLSNFVRFPNCKKCGSAKISGSNCYMYDPDRDAVSFRKKFRKICDQHIKRFMDATNQKKTRHTHEILGYTPQELQDHILNHPDFEKVKNGIWHVDHYFPIKAFLDHEIFDLSIVNDLDNIRPLSGIENLSKADKYDKNEFEGWLKNYQKKSSVKN